MTDAFFEKPILNSPYAYPVRHWELNDSGQPTQQIIETRRRADFITPIPKPRKRKGNADQATRVFDEGRGLSTQEKRYDHITIITAVCNDVDKRRTPSNVMDWSVTPETARYPQTGEVRSDSAEGIACWFIDAYDNDESFFLGHAYFVGANDACSALDTKLKAEINEEAWATFNGDRSRAFERLKSGRIAVKVINHLGKR